MYPENVPATHGYFESCTSLETQISQKKQLSKTLFIHVLAVSSEFMYNNRTNHRQKLHMASSRCNGKYVCSIRRKRRRRKPPQPYFIL